MSKHYRGKLSRLNSLDWRNFPFSHWRIMLSILMSPSSPCMVDGLARTRPPETSGRRARENILVYISYPSVPEDYSSSLKSMRLKYLPAQVLQVQVTHLSSEPLWLHCAMAHYMHLHMRIHVDYSQRVPFGGPFWGGTSWLHLKFGNCLWGCGCLAIS